MIKVMLTWTNIGLLLISFQLDLFWLILFPRWNEVHFILFIDINECDLLVWTGTWPCNDLNTKELIESKWNWMVDHYFIWNIWWHKSGSFSEVDHFCFIDSLGEWCSSCYSIYDWRSIGRVLSGPVILLKIDKKWSVNLQTIWRKLVDEVLKNKLSF